MKDVTLKAYWEDGYKAHLEQLAPSTQQGYENVFKLYIGPKFGSRVMSGIRASEMQVWFDTLSYGVAKHIKAILSGIFNDAFRDGLVSQNIMRTRFRMPKRAAVKVDNAIFTHDELDAILEACAGEWWEPYYILAAFSGLRRSETVGVRVEDITDHDGYLAVDIHRNVQRVRGRIVIRETTKTGVDRYAIVPPPYSYRLSELVGGRESGWLVSDGDSPINPDNLTVAWRRWFQTQSFKAIPWKNLRNSYVTWMNTEGHDSALVSKLCGNSTLVQYANYNRPTPDDLISGLKA